MALDLSAFRKKLNELQSGVKGPFWKPKDPETVIRMVPLKSNPSNPFQELYFHYIDNKTYLSPVTFGDPDPFVELSKSLVAQGNLSKDEFKAAMRLKPVPRTYVPIIVRGEEKMGVRFWGFNQGIFKDLLVVMSDGEYGDITDVESGHDIKVTFTSADKSPTKFSETKIMIRPKASVLASDPEQLEKFLNDQPVLLDEYTVATYDELQALLDKQFGATPAATPAPAKAAAAAATEDDEWATPNSSAPVEAAPPKTTVRGASKPASKPAAPVASDTAEEEFDDIFNS